MYLETDVNQGNHDSGCGNKLRNFNPNTKFAYSHGPSSDIAFVNDVNIEDFSAIPTNVRLGSRGAVLFELNGEREAIVRSSE